MIIGAPVLIGGILISQIQKRNEAKDEASRWECKWENDLGVSRFTIRSSGDSDKIIYDQPASKIPRITFERFLNLYAVNPEKWRIETSEWQRLHNFPIYVNKIKTTNKRGKEVTEEVAIPLYWTSPEELKKYYNWVEEKFEKGEGALYENARNESLKQLTEYINEDLKEKRAQTEKDLEAIEGQLKEQLKEKKDTIPQLTLDPPTRQYTSTTQNWQDTAQSKITFPPPVYQNTNAPISEEDLQNTYGLRRCHYYGMVNDLPVGGNEIGDIYYLADLGVSCIYTKDGWEAIKDGEIENPFHSLYRFYKVGY